MNKPIAVCISDIHFNTNTLGLASTSLHLALMKAESLNIPLIVAGDLNDSKAIIRGEVANRLILLLKEAKTPVYILSGNHDLLNEKGDEHSLNFLEPYAVIISELTHGISITDNLYFLPYQNSNEKVKEAFKKIPKGSIVIMHQGVQGAYMGDYIVDKTSVDKEELSGYKIISGHYHRHQTVGSVTYIGSPYTITFGEANDGPKGFLIMNEDGSFTREILELRKHVKIERDVKNLFDPIPGLKDEDLLWLKVTGPASELHKFSKQMVSDALVGHQNFRLDLIPAENDKKLAIAAKDVKPSDIFIAIIESLEETEDQKDYLKGLYYEIIE